MLKLLAFGIAAGAGFQAWRNYPADGVETTRSLWLLLVLGIVFAYLGGRWHGRHHRSAYAAAHAEAHASAGAQSTVNLAVFTAGQGPTAAAGHSVDLVRAPDESAPWLDSTPRAQISADDLDGMDLSEFVDDREEVT